MAEGLEDRHNIFEYLGFLSIFISQCTWQDAHYSISNTRQIKATLLKHGILLISTVDNKCESISIGNSYSDDVSASVSKSFVKMLEIYITH